MATVTYNIPSTYTWTCPAGVTSVTVTCYGGGAGGTGYPGGGGGGGACAVSVSSVTPGSNYTVVVGGGGTANTFENGGSSEFKLGSTYICAAVGGYVGDNYYGGAGGSAGSNFYNSYSYSGGDGGRVENLDGGGGGGGAATYQDGGNGYYRIGGYGPEGADGGNGSEYGYDNGSAGLPYGGGGGGGALDSPGYDGATGAVIIDYADTIRKRSWGGGAAYFTMGPAGF